MDDSPYSAALDLDAHFDAAVWLGCPHPLEVEMALNGAFTPVWHEWELDTVRDEVERTWGAPPSVESMEMAGALQGLVLTSYFWEHWVPFEKICRALLGLPVHPDVMQATDIPTIATACDIVGCIRTPEFGEEVAKYVAARAIHDGNVRLPDILAFAVPYLQKALSKVWACEEPSGMLWKVPPDLEIVDPRDTEDPVTRQAQMANDVNFAVISTRRAFTQGLAEHMIGRED